MGEGAILGAVAFLLVAPWGNAVIRTLLARGIGKRIRVDGPATHQSKSGTATMGGLYILAPLVVIVACLVAAGHKGALLPLVAMLAYGLLGAFDDLQGLKDVAGVGWLARAKFPWQWVLAFAVAFLLYLAMPTHPLIIPLSGDVVELGLWVIPITALTLVFATNAVNLTDGLDGLAGGTSAIAYAAYGVLASVAGAQSVALFCLALVGVLMAFLWYNVHPARLFMGDTGSEALGAGLAVVAIMSGYGLLLPIIGALFWAVALSVMLQVSYFKYTRRRYGEGRRIFRMAPLHHHFELVGWAETQITLRFWIVGAVAALVGVGLGVMRW
jgi:phospho-N-acetylmuramoyl-pentapeptide-transferase